MTDNTNPEAALRARIGQIRTEVGKAIIGQEAAVTGLVIGLLAGGHVLLEGVPGVAKTLLVRSLASSINLETKRVQFTPDLMPSDLTGSLVYNSGSFEFRPGPVFTNLLLADEINRTPPKTQSALLEAMEERQVTVDGNTRALPDPFMVIATQNPVEYEGTYPLPEAQLDRFLLKIVLPLPERAAEVEILHRHASGFNPRALQQTAGIQSVIEPGDIAAARAAISHVQVAPEVLAYVVDIVRATRTQPSVRLGVSPRGATALLHASRAWAWMAGRSYVTPDDVKGLTQVTLRHRLTLHSEAELEGVTAERVLESILATVPVPR
ncbi:MAG: MoxR family ATPase [Buchananella hordeovulneris]|nr:MoxR family ATPase [Buchananella hordeovulneris]